MARAKYEVREALLLATGKAWLLYREEWDCDYYAHAITTPIRVYMNAADAASACLYLQSQIEADKNDGWIEYNVTEVYTCQ